MLSLTKCHRLLFAVLQYPASDLATDSSSRLYENENPFPCMPHLSFRHRHRFVFFFPSLLSRSELIITSRPFMSWACLGRHHHLPSLRLYAEVPFIPPLLATWRSSHLFGSTRAISGSTVPSSRLFLKTPQTAAAARLKLYYVIS